MSLSELELQNPRPSTPIATIAFGIAFYVLLTFAAWTFWPAITGPFVFDDFPNLQNLAQLGGHVDRSSVGYYLFSFVDNPGRPLSALSFLIEDANWPSSPDSFKRDNIFFHLIAGALVFWLAYLLARQRKAEGHKAFLVALACSAMWLLHPMQLSATMLVVQRMNILSTIFMLGGLIAYLKTLDAKRMPQLLRVAAAGAVLGLFGVLAYLCKENGALIFAYATALNLTLLQARIRELAPANRHLLLWGAAAPILLLAIIAVLYRNGIVADYEMRSFTLGERLLTEARILVEYLGMILLPRVGGQGIFHDDYVVSRSLLDPFSTLFAVAAVLGLLVSSIGLRKRHPVYAFAVLWFFAGHLMESTVIALELYFEHRNYMPMIGPLFALSMLLVGTRGIWRAAAGIVFAVWIGTAALSTHFNAGIWGNGDRLARVWAEQSPDSMRAIQMMASHYANVGDVDEARRILNAGYARLPEHRELAMQRVLLDCIDRGLAPGQWQRLVDIAGASGYSRGIPDLASAFVKEVNAGRCHGTLSRNEVRAFIAQLFANPKLVAEESTRGHLHYELSKLALADHDLDDMMAQMDLSYRYRPDPLVAREQAIYLLSAGLPTPALRYLAISDATHVPWPKSWFLGIQEKNAPLRQSALRMQGIMDTQQHPH